MKFIIVIMLIFCSVTIAETETLRLVHITLPHHDHVYGLRQFDIIDAGPGFAKAIATDRDITALRMLGYPVDILIEDYQAYKDELFARGFYHTYTQLYAVLDSFVTNYPSICRLDTIGFSVQGRAIWAMRVTDNPSIEEPEAEIRLPANMHGDEHIGTEITLYFLRYLLENYASNSQVQDLVNNREIWVIPTHNPDGKVANSRYNANNVDLNRDFGFFWGGEGNSPSPISQIENKAMYQHLEENDIALEYNYHSAAQYVNYPWDYHPADPPDSQHIVLLSEIYADSANLTAINGYAWYQVTGSLQDYTIGTTGALAWTIECLEPSGSSQIDQICYDNRDALMDVCARAGWGIEGGVQDSMTGTPLHARIEFLNPDRIDVYTDPVLGDFHKMIEPGTYDVRVSANGYSAKTMTNVVVPSTGSVDMGIIALSSDSSMIYAFRSCISRYSQHAEQSNRTRPRAALGPQDNNAFSLGQSGYIVLDMGSSSPIMNSSGDDFTVYEGDDGTSEGYQVFVGDSWEGPWLSCGNGMGTSNFDLTVAGVSQARYVRIVDDGTATSGPYAGFDLDAIHGTPPVNAPNLFIADHQIDDGNNGILEPGETAGLLVTLRNSGILAALNTNALLRTTDAYVGIVDSQSYYGDILPDSQMTNTGDPFTIYADASTPIGHSAHFDILITADNYNDTVALDIVVGKKCYYIWNPDPTPEPGQNMHTILTSLGYTGDYGVTLAPDLDLYVAVLVCCGIYSNNHVIGASSPEATALVDFVQAGGRMYLEGGDVWYYDPPTGYDFGPLFGINATDDGNSDGGPFIGQASTFTNGMDFDYNGENNWIDHISPTGTGFLIFYDEDNSYDCGVANDAGSYRTVGTSWELGLLVDGTPPSTRAALLDSIMKFFGCQISPGVKEQSSISTAPVETMLRTIGPNPGNGVVEITYQIAHTMDVQISVYDASGRCIRKLLDTGAHDPGLYTIVWDARDAMGRNVSAGVYFVHLITPETVTSTKIIQLR